MSVGWTWAQARAVGTAHLKHGLPCQDSIACRVWQRAGHPPVLVAALADGAGSADRAEVGSALATSLFVDIATEAFDDGATMEQCAQSLRYAVGETKRALALKAGHDSRELNDYASTLLAAILSLEGGVIGQIGDGAVVVGERDKSWRPVHWPDHGEFANTTNFLTQPDALDHLRLATFVAPVTRLAMFSDGLERLVLDFQQRAAHGPFFDSIFARMRPPIGAGHLAEISDDLAILLASDKVNARTDDDKSLLCAALVEL
jgi:hypothetical protein